MVDYTPTDNEPADQENVKDGKYLVRCINVDESTSKAGNNCLVLDFEVLESRTEEVDTSKVAGVRMNYYYVVLGNEFTNRNLRALGYDVVPGKPLSLDLEDIKGRTCVATVRREAQTKGKHAGQEFPRVAWIAADGRSEEQKKADAYKDIPF